MPGGVAGAQSGPSSVTVAASPRWGLSTPGSWTPYIVTARNDGDIDIEGELVLVPNGQPGPADAATRAPAEVANPSSDPDAPTSTNVVALSQKEITTGTPPAPFKGPDQFPDYRATLTLGPGIEKTVTMLVVEAPYGYHAEVRDQGRAERVIARSAVAVVPGGDPTGPTIALLTQAENTQAALQTVENFTGGPAGVITTFASATDFPDTALDLAALQILVVTGFDSASLTAAQIRAIEDFVVLGGGLVLGGGTAASRTVAPLPDGLVPLSPASTAPASMAVLADLVGRTTDATGDVTRGQLHHGRTVLETADGTPLVVEHGYGAGRVVQLTYDPFVEPFASDRMLRQVGWDQGLLRATDGFEGRQAGAPPDQLWSAVLGLPRWQPWPHRLSWALALDVLLAIPLGYAILRRLRRVGLFWMGTSVIAILVTTVTAALLWRGDVRPEVEVKAVSPMGAVLRSTYSGFQSGGEGEHKVEFGDGEAASTVFAPPNLTVADSSADLRRGGVSGGSVSYAGDRPTLAYRHQNSTNQNVHRLSVEHEPGLESHLRVTGAGPPDQGGLRVVGSITNRSSKTLRNVIAQLPEGAQARFDEEIAPGATIAVDRPFIWAGTIEAGKGLPSTREEQVMFAAAAAAFTRNGQVAVAAMASRPERLSATGPDNLSVMVQVAPLEASSNTVAGIGSSRAVTTVIDGEGGRTTAFDMGGVPGLTPRRLTYSNAESAEVYDWTSRTWRPLPVLPRYADGDVPITPTEAEGPVVRVRVRSHPRIPPTVGIAL